MPDRFDRFVQDYHRHLLDDPNACVFLGVDERLGELPDPSAAAHEARASRARALLARLEAMDRAALDFEGNLDADLARLTLEARDSPGDSYLQRADPPCPDAIGCRRYR